MLLKKGRDGTVAGRAWGVTKTLDGTGQSREVIGTLPPVLVVTPQDSRFGGVNGENAGQNLGRNEHRRWRAVEGTLASRPGVGRGRDSHLSGEGGTSVSV